MTKKSNQAKIKFWQTKLKKLEAVELPRALVRAGTAGVGGDWHENAEFEDAERQVEVIRSRMDDIKKLINKLRQETPKSSKNNGGVISTKSK